MIALFVLIVVIAYCVVLAIYLGGELLLDATEVFHLNDREEGKK